MTYAHPEDVFQFEPVKDHHLPMIFEWLQRPHVREWWDEPEIELGYIKDALAGKDRTRPFIFSYNGTVIGFIQYWVVGDEQSQESIEKDPWLAELPADALGVDIMIADRNRLSKGMGSSALRQFVNMLVKKGHHTIIIDPEETNTRAVRAYEKAGFKPVPHLLGKAGKALLMQYEIQDNRLNA